MTSFRLWRRGIACLAPVATLAAAPAAAEWREATTDHFRIYADAGEKWLRGYAERLERIDAAMRYVRGMTQDQDARSNRLTVYVAGGEGAVQKLCGKCRNVAGFYVPRAGGSVAFTAVTAASDITDLKSDTILFHEYAHHFMLGYSSLPLPRWLVEGFAEFNASAKVERDGTVGIGMTAMHRAYGLVVLQKLPIEKLLDPPDKPFSPEQTEVFYGRSWLLTHMLTMVPARKGQLAAYLRLLNDGKPNLEAARTAFGDLKTLDRDLDRYMNGRINYLRIEPSKIAIGEIKVRAVSPGEDAMMTVRMRSDRGVTREQALELVPEARRRAAPFPDDAAVQAQLAEAEYDAGNDAEAEAAADRAIAADPQSRDGLLYKARVLIRRAVAGKQTDPKVWQAARSWIVKANRLDPNAAEPLLLYYTSFGAQHAAPSKSAIAGLARAYELSPQDQGLRMLYVRQSLIDGDAKAARTALLPLAYDPHNRAGSNRALALLQLIDAGQIKDALAGTPEDDESNDDDPSG